MLESIIKEFEINAEAVTITPVHLGLINNTWKVETGAEAYILQKINHKVFKNPRDVADNISMIADYLQNNHPDYVFTTPLKISSGQPILETSDGNYFRMFPFIKNSQTKTIVEEAAQGFEAARQFGKFTAVLKGFDVTQLKTTIPSFHDLGLRYRQFLEALQNGNPERIKESGELILQLKGWSGIKEEYEKIKLDNRFKLRVTHHDTKISNVLFDDNNKGICVIDLDTVMPGYFISDVGDMIRTYLSPVSEEEQDMNKIVIRKEIYEAIVDGYMSEMKDELTDTEKEHFFYAGCFMTYMQALRFVTDYLNNDVYYGATYPRHNLIRAKNQAVLLENLIRLNENQTDRYYKYSPASEPISR